MQIAAVKVESENRDQKRFKEYADSRLNWKKNNILMVQCVV